MLSTFLFLITIASGLTQVVSVLKQPCEAQTSGMSQSCSRNVITSQSCNESIFTIDTDISKLCDQVHIGWPYPLNNLTITIETPFTKKRQPYNLSFDNTWLHGSSFHFYRVLDGEETEIKSSDDVLVQKSDSNYQVILKVQAERSISLYVLFIKYNITKA